MVWLNRVSLPIDPIDHQNTSGSDDRWHDGIRLHTGRRSKSFSWWDCRQKDLNDRFIGRAKICRFEHSRDRWCFRLDWCCSWGLRSNHVAGKVWFIIYCPLKIADWCYVYRANRETACKWRIVDRYVCLTWQMVTTMVSIVSLHIVDPMENHKANGNNDRWHDRVQAQTLRYSRSFSWWQGIARKIWFIICSPLKIPDRCDAYWANRETACKWSVADRFVGLTWYPSVVHAE